MEMQKNWADRPLGMRDVYPQYAKLRRHVESKLLSFFEGQGYELVSSGVFEYVDTLLRGRHPEDAENWVQLFDNSGKAIALRPEMTPSIARMAAPLLAAGRTQLQWCYAERVYRRSTDPASLSLASGKAAESTQVGVEWIGHSGVGADCQLLSLCAQTVRSLGIINWQLVISHALFGPEFLMALGLEPHAVDKLMHTLTAGDYVGFRQQCAQIGIQFDVLRLLSSVNPFHPESLDRHMHGLTLVDSLHQQRVRVAWDDLVQLAAQLKSLGLDEGISFDLTLYRDLSYYTGIVFEVFAAGAGAPIVLGGRYDDLLAQFGAPAPAIGFVFEVERVLTVLTQGTWANGSVDEVVGRC